MKIRKGKPYYLLPFFLVNFEGESWGRFCQANLYSKLAWSSYVALCSTHKLAKKGSGLKEVFKLL